MAQETSKQRWNRIELDYYKGRGASAWWRSGSAVLILIASAAWLILAPSWDLDGGTSPRLFQTKHLASPGPLARPHAIWESRCEACHSPFVPINGSRWAPIPDPSARTSDANCRACHAGLPHHANQPEALACAGCHRDHRGRDEPLTRIGDNACVVCHADLKDRPGKLEGETLAIENSVTRFDRIHPEFSSVRPAPDGTPKRDPGRLKFNHRLHLTPGMNPEPGGLPLMKYADLNDRDRQRYGWKPDTDLRDGVALNCNACHRLAQESASSRSEGGKMLPVMYELDCRSCHPLPFDPRLPVAEARHGIPWNQVVGEIRQLYEVQAIREEPDLLGRPLPGTEIPGNRARTKLATVNQAVEAKVTAAVRRLLPNGKGGCTECHSLNSPIPPMIRSSDADSLAIERVRVPEVWLTRARFDHRAHRAIRCDSCHVGAGASTTSADILLPGIKTCLECHSPPAEHSSGTTGGAGFGCTECHRYHGEGSQSRGGESSLPSSNPDARPLKSIREFLDGVVKIPEPR